VRLVNLIPADVLQRRLRDRALSTVARGLCLWILLLAAVVGWVGDREHGRREMVADLESHVRALDARIAQLDSLRKERVRLAATMAGMQRLEMNRPVTSAVSLLSTRLPARLRLEALTIEPLAPGAGDATLAAGQTPTAGGCRVSMSGTAASADDVALLLRALQDSQAFQRLQLTRVGQQGTEASSDLTFELRCER
jgi:Tfp pilus assembly protein PilN